MKLYNLFILLFSFHVATAQENEFCRLSEKKINELCGYLENNQTKNNKTELVFYVTAKNAGELKTISDWAHKKGYGIEYTGETNVDTALALKKTVDVFSSTAYQVMYNDIEQGLNKMGVGCFAVKIDTCEDRRRENILRFYNKYVATRINPEAIYLSQLISFDFGKGQKIDELAEWARANGYKAEESTWENTSSETGELKKYIDLKIEKLLEKRDVDYFMDEVNKVTAAMIKLKMLYCLNSGMGLSPASTMK